MSIATQSETIPDPSSDWLQNPHKVARKALHLLISLLVLILVHPVVGEGAWQRRVLGAVTFVPLILASLNMRRRSLRAICLGSMAIGAVLAVTADITGNRMVFAAQWLVLTVAFVSVVRGMFLYLRTTTEIHAGHLYIAVSIYLLLAVVFYCIYSAAAALNPHAFMQTTTGPTHAPADLLYFSLTTLTTLGYGDIVPVGGSVRMLAGLEAGTGVMYAAVTIAVLVSRYKRF
jgi:hypothetical protein